MIDAESSLALLVNRFTSDLGALERKWWDMPYSPPQQEQIGEFFAGWATALEALQVAPDDVEGSIDRVLLGSEIRYRLELLAREERTLAEVASLLPFGDDILALLASRRFMKPVDRKEVAGSLAALAVAVVGAEEALKSGAAAGGAGPHRRRPDRHGRDGGGPGPGGS